MTSDSGGGGAGLTIRPGRPFWSALTAFGSSMVGLIGLDRIDTTPINVEATLGGALVVSLFVAAAVYGKEKIADLQPGKKGEP